MAQLPEISGLHDLRWIRAPRQARTHQSLERMLDAAESLLEDRDFEALHITELARRAKTSVASFYRRFKDKEGLLHALHERRCEEAYATADDALTAERWEGASVSEILHAVIPFLLEVLHSHERLDRAILRRVASDDAMRERQTKLSQYVIAGLSDLLLERRREFHHPDPERAVSFGLVQALSLLFYHQTLGTGGMSPRELDDDVIANEIVTSFLAYLGVRDPYAPVTPN